MLRRSSRNRFAPLALRLSAAFGGLVTVAALSAGCMLERQGELASQCTSDAQCDDGNACTSERCDPSGLCEQALLPDGVAPDQLPGDCLRRECSGGVLIEQGDAEDVPADDGDPCTLERCGADGPLHEPQDDGSPCADTDGNPGLCFGHECSVECTPTTASGCQDIEICTIDGCDATTGQCVNAPQSGVAAPEQVAADCKLVVCADGAAQPTIDNADVVDDGNPCTADRCDSGVPSNLPLDVGTPCDEAGGRMCDGDPTAPSCVECMAASDCPGEVQLCRGPTCDDNHVCGEDFADAGTPLGPQTAGDCLVQACDGAGSPITTTDALDVPDDSNPCTTDVCSESGAGHDFASATTPCGADLALQCDGAGHCVGCVDPADCGLSTACMSWSCDAGSCEPIYVAADTAPPELVQTSNDCLERRCNGIGGVNTVALNSDLPLDDGNDCTAEQCILGAPLHVALPLNVSCGLDNAFVCDGAAHCVECNAASQCPDPGIACWEAACIDHGCDPRTSPAGVPAAPAVQQLGDCHILMCAGFGETTISNDDADVPVDGNDCTQDVCTDGAPSNPFEPEGAPCGPTDSWTCDAAGRCIECTSNDDCTAPDVCDPGTGRCACAAEPCSRCTTEWSHGHGNGAHDQFAEAAATDGADTLVVVGRIKAPVDFGAGLVFAHSAKYDGFVAAFDPIGASRWTRTLGDGGADQHVTGAAVGGDGSVVVTGRFEGTIDFGGRAVQSLGTKYDGFVAKYDSLGSLRWVTTFGNGADDQHGESVALDANGRVFVTGRIKGGVDFGAGQAIGSDGKYDLFVASYDSEGAFRWARAFGNGADDQFGESVAVDGAGNVTVTGRIKDGVVFGGGPAIGHAGKFDLVLASFDADGSYRWAHAFGNGAQDQYGESIAIDADGNVVVTGRIKDGVDFGGGVAIGHVGKFDLVLASFDADGSYLWAHAFGNGAQDQFGEAVSVDAAGHVVVTGRIKGGVDFGSGQPIGHAAKFDVVAAMFDSTGVHLCSRAFGNGTLDQHGQGVASLGVEQFVLAGRFMGTVDFGLGPLASADPAKYDLYLARFGP